MGVLTSDYQTLRDQLFQENNLLNIVGEFRSSSDRVWHISAHSIRPKYEARQRAASVTKGGVRLGVDLLREWRRSKKEIASVYISDPYLVVPSKWLSGVRNATSPYVYICLAKDQGSFDPVMYTEAVSKSFWSSTDSEGSGLISEFMPSSDPDESGDEGSWIIRVDETESYGWKDDDG